MCWRFVVSWVMWVLSNYIWPWFCVDVFGSACGSLYHLYTEKRKSSAVKKRETLEELHKSTREVMWKSVKRLCSLTRGLYLIDYSSDSTDSVRVCYLGQTNSAYNLVFACNGMSVPGILIVCGSFVNTNFGTPNDEHVWVTVDHADCVRLQFRRIPVPSGAKEEFESVMTYLAYFFAMQIKAKHDNLPAIDLAAYPSEQ
jgi:hypothetical protein